MKGFLQSVFFLVTFLFLGIENVAGQDQEINISPIFNSSFLSLPSDLMVVTTVSGRVYRDRNGNGMQETLDPGLNNIDVIIFDSAGTSQAVTTDANGDWMAVVAPGTVNVSIDNTDLPLGYIQTEGVDPQVLTAVVNVNNNAGKDGYYFEGQVSGHLYFDTNGNGQQDPGEPNMPNVDIDITDEFGTVITVTTDANGDWMATVAAVNVTVAINQTDPDFPTGAIQTEGTDPTTVTVISNQNNFTDNDGFYLEGVLEGHVYFDLNGNGTQDAGEPNMSNVDVEVVDSLGNIHVVVTDVNGNWSIVLPAGPATSTIDINDSDFPAGATQTEGTNPTTTTVINAQIVSDDGVLNDGFYESGTLEGHVYFDVNGDGQQDAGEPDMPNVDVIITTSTGQIITVTTDANGNWSILTSVGNTTVLIDINDPDFPTGATQTEGTNPTISTVLINQTVSDDGILNDGFYEVGTLEGHLYFDLNGNGTQDTSEPDMHNVDVMITDALNNQQIVVTDANGDWSVNVPAGSTESDIDQADPDFPTGAIQTEGTDPTITNVITGQTVSDDGLLNDGFFEEGILTGHLYYDTNSNGTQDPGEPNLPNVDVEITDALGIVQIVVTDIAGNWSVNVPIGNTTSDIDETDPDFPAGAIQTEGTDPTTTLVTPNSSIAETNDGFVVPTLIDGTLTGHLYYDTNSNGTQDLGEPNLPNVDVNITNVLGITQTVTTDVNGNWGIVVPEGNTTSNIDQIDPDFPTGAIQTEGTDPTTTLVIGNSVVAETNDGFVIPTLTNGTLTGHLYYDVNGNGIQDLGEPNLPNIDIEITNVLAIIQTIVSDANGDWSIVVPEGNTISDIDQTDPDFPLGAIQTQGTDPTTTNVIANNTTAETPDGFTIPNLQNGILEAHLYEDLNGNATQDSGEPNLPNIDVVITNVLGLVQTIATDVNGNWSITVPVGNTISNIDESDPDFNPAFVQTEGTDPTTTNVIANTTSNEVNDGFQDSGLAVGTLTGHLYEDLNGNNTQDTGEPNLPNIDVEITNVLGVIQILTTDVNGDWSVNVPIGNTISNIDENDPDYNPLFIQTEGTDPTTTLVVANVSTSEVNDGFTIPTSTTGTLNGHLYNDVNANGNQDLGEANLPNIDVEIIDALGILQIVVTDANGDWQASLPQGPATSNIDFTDPDFPAGATQTEGTNPTTTVVVLNVITNEPDDGFNFTGTQTGTLNGHLYNDLNGNGNQEAGEPDLADIDVEITDALGIIQTVVTDVTGNWQAILPEGVATSDIDFTDPDFPVGVTQTEGTNPTSTVVVNNVNTNEPDDGFEVPINNQNYSGHIYLDLNGSFSQDSNEPDLPNIDIEIIDANNITHLVTSDANGNWSISLPFGNVTTTIQTNDPDFPANAVQTEGDNPTSNVIVLGTSLMELDGFYVTELSTERITGHMYEDVNGNSIQDSNEPNIPNIDVEVSDALGITQTVESDVNGDWEALVPLGNALSFIQTNDLDFPEYTTQTQGSNPTMITVTTGDVNNELDGFYLERLKVFNAITPNNDGKNDFLYIQGIDRYPDNKMTILNRWGVVVYEAINYGQNGKLFKGLSEGRATLGKDEQLPTGTYFYFMEYRDELGDLKKIDGYLYIN